MAKVNIYIKIEKQSFALCLAEADDVIPLVEMCSCPFLRYSLSTPCRNFSNFFLKMMISVISVQILVWI